MSYDVQIWSTEPACFPSSLPDRDKWNNEEGVWIRPGRNWQIVVGNSDRVLPEDIPAEISPSLPGINFLTEINLEPIAAPKAAHKVLARTVTSIAKQAHGVVVDPQADTIETPSGVKRYTPKRREERFSLLQLGWWLVSEDLFTPQGIETFIACLENWLPEAMPKRYGLYEPPQHIFEMTGRQHFLDFLASNIAGVGIVWYPHRPVMGVSVFSNCGNPDHPQEFRCNYVTVSVEAATLTQAGWPEGLRRFWRQASRIIRPFYGEVRAMDGFIPSGGTYSSDMSTELNPIGGPFWKGIPKKIGQAAVLGQPYLSLWPRFSEAADHDSGLAFISTDAWQRREEVSSLIGGVPKQIAQQWTPKWKRRSLFGGGYEVNWNTENPAVWPFEGKPVDDVGSEPQ